MEANQSNVTTWTTLDGEVVAVMVIHAVVVGISLARHLGRESALEQTPISGYANMIPGRLYRRLRCLYSFTPTMEARHCAAG